MICHLLGIGPMWREGLGVNIEEADVEQFYKLGRKEEGKERPLLVKFARQDNKNPS